MRIEWKNLFRAIALFEAVLLLVLTFSYGNKIDNLKKTVKEQNKTIEQCNYEIKRLKLIEQNFEEEKEYLYECYKDIELKAERSGK
jgi:hypothetical protein